MSKSLPPLLMPVKKKKKKAAPKAKAVKFTYKGDAKTVAVAGSFNKWSKTKNKMKKGLRKSWSCSIKLKPGRYEYRFVLNGSDWVNDPKAKECCGNDQGTQNCVKTVR